MTPQPLLTSRIRLRGRICFFVILGAFLAANLDPNCRTEFSKLFGARPWGLPVVPVVSAIEALLLLPLFWVAPHFLLVAHLHVHEEKSGIPFPLPLELALMMLTMCRKHPSLLRSQVIAITGTMYLLGLLISLIAYMYFHRS
jgi:hypothetical protein